MLFATVSVPQHFYHQEGRENKLLEHPMGHQFHITEMREVEQWR
jgi:hypothetical protein